MPYIITVAILALAGGVFWTIAKQVAALDNATELSAPRIEGAIETLTDVYASTGEGPEKTAA